ncbi:Major capsid protein [Micromonospora saelicesensis]|uniref:Major capsid protein n=1 Tax=Micromonospora saelicesensis TaxID=285676 RepID=A0ABX9CAJ3_9ACTN|nr:phage major capsid protein [Micromonospora saelicesensis]RAN92654.1 Major capsid protein [Micromonospora saelicesensis]
MSTALMERLKKELSDALTPARDIAAKAEAEKRDLTDVERATVTEAVKTANGIKGRIDQAKADNDLTKQLGDLGDGISFEPGAKERNQPTDGLWTPRKGETIGQAFVKSNQYKSLLSEANGGTFGKNQRVHSAPFGAKALVTGLSDTSAGALVVNDNIGLQVGLEAFQRPLKIRDLVTNGNTTSDAIEYVRVTSTTNAAAPVAEATSAALPTQNGSTGPLINNAGGGYKPESALALAKVSTTVKTIAHWIPATKRALADAGQVRTLIDQFLRYGLEEELEDQMVNGDGTGENFEGLNTVSGTQSQAYDTDILTTLRKAKTKVRTVGRSIATAYVMNPADWEKVDLLQDNEARYYFGGPMREGQPTVWGLPVVESEAVAEGAPWVGAWRKAVLWDREQATVQATDSHADFFIRNLVAILGEMRAGFGIIQPNAFVEIDITA